MSKTTIHIEAMPLKIKLKTTFRHAAATRSEGESIWIQAKRNGAIGYGEGCPRVYVAGDDLESSLQWVKDNFTSGKVDFGALDGLDELKEWIENHKKEIDTYPSAWCALEMALLDLLARERACTVETLLGISGTLTQNRYTAVLGDDNLWRYATVLDQYFIREMTDFKIKLNGDLDFDKEKLNVFKALCSQYGAKNTRIRVDANNLWKSRCDDAIRHIQQLGEGVFAVEEPVGPRDAVNMSRVSTATGLPVILDESLCTFEDLSLFSDLPGKFIANIKISRVGGLLRALKLISQIKRMEWPIIIGCHTGETSLLTRAALVAAAAADGSLLAQEGAFGDYLMDNEPVKPILKFGHYGLLNLREPYHYSDLPGIETTEPDRWKLGLGLQCRMPAVQENVAPGARSLRMDDGYTLHYRLWGKAEGDEVLLMLHGGMDHSGWMAPLATELRSLSPNLSIVAPDRRGCGLNQPRGDLGSIQILIEDLIQQIVFLKKSFSRIHLAGWSHGAQYATIVAQRSCRQAASLILLAPGFVWSDRYRAILKISEKTVLRMLFEFKLKPERNRAYIPFPMEATDLTLVDQWRDFIEKDELKTTVITLRSLRLMEEVQELSLRAIPSLSLPALAFLANDDRMVDNEQTRKWLGNLFTSDKVPNRLITETSGHAMLFEEPEKVAAKITVFLSKLSIT